MVPWDLNSSSPISISPHDMARGAGDGTTQGAGSHTPTKRAAEPQAFWTKAEVLERMTKTAENPQRRGRGPLMPKGRRDSRLRCRALGAWGVGSRGSGGSRSAEGPAGRGLSGPRSGRVTAGHQGGGSRNCSGPWISWPEILYRTRPGRALGALVHAASPIQHQVGG